MSDEADGGLPKLPVVELAQLKAAPVEWLSVGFAALLLAGVAASVAAAGLELLPLWLAAAANLALFYFCEAVAHDAVHRNVISGSPPADFLNDAIGYVTAGVLFWDFRVFRYLHSKHHRHTSEPDEDPDFHLKNRPLPVAILRGFLQLPCALAMLIRDIRYCRCEMPERATQASFVLFYGSAAALLALAPKAVLVLWVGPAVIATALLALGHSSLHSSAAPGSVFRTTRIVSARGWQAVLVRILYIRQNHHLSHHMFPHIPFHRLERATMVLQAVYSSRAVEPVDFTQRLHDRLSAGKDALPLRPIGRGQPRASL